MEIVTDQVDTDPEVRLAYTLFMDGVEELRHSKRELSTNESAEIAERLLAYASGDMPFKGRRALVTDDYWAGRIARFGKTLRTYRDARAYFVSPNGTAALHAEMVGLDGLAAVSKIRSECNVEFNTLLAAEGLDAYMTARKSLANGR